jgi:quercetin dioxygenase-like cupin family protein
MRTAVHYNSEDDLGHHSSDLRAKNERSIMKNKKLMLVLLCLMTGPLMAQEPKVTPLMSKDLTDIPGREVLMIIVEYAPGGADPIHRHNAHGFIYVLEGSVVMQVKGGKQVTLTPGQTFYEGPDDVHVVGRNASSTKPAKFLVFLMGVSKSWGRGLRSMTRGDILLGD